MSAMIDADTPGSVQDDRPLLRRTQRGRGAVGEGTARPVDYRVIRDAVHARLLDDLTASPGGRPEHYIRARIGEVVADITIEMGLSVTGDQRRALVEDITHDVLGFGPLEPLLADPDITEIMVNGPDTVFVERNGLIYPHPTVFEDNAHLMQVVERIIAGIGRRLDESSPMVDARLHDGSRVNVILPPLALNGPVMTIRKFNVRLLDIEDIVRLGALTPDMVSFLAACVRARLNILVSGGTGAGKTTLLNLLSGFIPNDERVVTIEDAAELQMQGPHIVRLESRPANAEGSGKVTIRDLLINSLRMRPDRIVIGESRAGEALDMLQAMNTGHEGSMTTVHANSGPDAINRLETLVLMAGEELPLSAVRDQIGSALDIVVQLSRMADGSRKVTSISEVIHRRKQEPDLAEIFTFREAGVGDDGGVLGTFQATGTLPSVLERLQARGQVLPLAMFSAPKSA